ncbi:MAG TPA: hypothetical protein VK892_24040, partial [Pyrinomonadaceae bacterium]|nr:hypothetical protein [Pyrinomonadaceae bacterium]
MKKNLFRAVGFLALTVLFFNVVSASAQDKIWQPIKESDLQKADSERTAKVRLYAAFSLNKTELQKVLNRAPEEFSIVSQNEQTILTLPMPNGNLERFSIQNSPIMAPELAAKYPEIQTYSGQGIDNPTATVRFDISPNGFRAMILSNEGTIYIEPYTLGDTADYISFNKRYLEPDEKRATCLVGGDVIDLKTEPVNFLPDAPQFINNGANLRTYRLALAATGEYTNRFRLAGSTDAEAKARALAQMNT